MRHTRSFLLLAAFPLALAACPSDEEETGSGTGTETSTSSTGSTTASTSGTTGGTTSGTSSTTSVEDPCAGLACGLACDSCDPNDTDCTPLACNLAGECVPSNGDEPIDCGSTTNPPTGGGTDGEDYCAGVVCGDECFPPCPDGNSCEQSVCDAQGECIGQSQFDPFDCGDDSTTSGGEDTGSTGSTGTTTG